MPSMKAGRAPRLSRAEDLQVLRDFLEDRNRFVRNAAIEALTRWMEAPVNEATKHILLPLLRNFAENQNEDSAVKICAVNALARFSHAEGFSLVRTITKDRDLAVRVSALNALVKFSRTEAFATIPFANSA